MLYLISNNMKATRCGAVKADAESGEFIYNTAAPNTPEHNVGVMRGIAEAHGFVIPDNVSKRGDVARTLAEDLSKLKLPEVKTMTDKDKIIDVIKSGVEADHSDDTILVALVNSGVPFKQAGKVFKEVMEAQGLRISNQTRHDKVFSLLKKARFKSPKTYEAVQAQIDAITNKENGIPDTSEKQAISLIKKYAKEGEFVLPKSPVTGGGKIKAEITAYMVANPTATKEEFSTFMLSKGKKENMINKTFEWFNVARQMADSIAAAA